MNERVAEFFGFFETREVNKVEVQELVNLIRADATEQANARANTSWALMCKKMVAAEREACAKVCVAVPRTGAYFAKLIRARGNI